MNFNPPPTASQAPGTSNTLQNSGTRSTRVQQSAWGLPAPGAASSIRRGANSVSTTSASTSVDTSRSKISSSPSPFTSTFSSVLSATSSQPDSTRSSQVASHLTSQFPVLQAGSQATHGGSLSSSSNSRAITPSAKDQSVTSAGLSQSILGGGSGGVHSNRGQTLSPPLSQYSVTSPTSGAFERSGVSGPINSAISSNSTGFSSVSKIVATQIFLLLGSITEKEGKAKWESQADAIRKLVEQNMENFPRYFCRLLVGNSPQIFPGSTRKVENPANYPILVKEMEKIKQDTAQANRIAEAIDTAEGEVYRDFDLQMLMQHFRLDPLAIALLASAFAHVSRQELRTKATSILSDNSEDMLKALADTAGTHANEPVILLTTCALRYLHGLASIPSIDREYQKVKYAFDLRYQRSNDEIPDEVSCLYSIMRLNQTEQGLYDAVQTAGPHITSKLDVAKTFLSNRSRDQLDERSIAGALLYMTTVPDWQPFDPSLFVSAIQTCTDVVINWTRVVREFDRPAFRITKQPFQRLYHALIQIALTDETFDVQKIWGGRWENKSTQLSFIDSFLACEAADVDVKSIPSFRQAYDPKDSLPGPEGISIYAEIAMKDPMISADAVAGLLDICLPLDKTPNQQDLANLAHAVRDKIGLFLCSAASMEWSQVRQQLMQGFIQSFLKKETKDYIYVLHTLWRLDKKLVALSLSDAHLEDPLELTAILELAVELDWLEELLTLTTGFAFDLAALAHRTHLIKFTDWAGGKMQNESMNFVNALSRFVVIKAQDELRISRDEQPEPRTVSLSMQTAYDMLRLLDEHMQDRVELKAIQRTFLQAYPRLILLCEGIKDNIDVDCKQSNAMPRSADAEMQELYKKMYGKELGVPEVISYLGKCKDSRNPAEVDLFACMIHGLFDEYSCFSEYPLDPLQKTALLFGGIIKVGLISDLTLRVARDMVIDSVTDYSPDASMFKFGLQALATFADRLYETDWIDYCKTIIHTPGLRGTQVSATASEAVRQNGSGVDADFATETSGRPNGVDDPDGVFGLNRDGGNMMTFKAIHAGLETSFEEPEEEIKDKVVFFFNNVSEQNLSTKFDQLSSVIRDQHYEWFADFLVNARAKMEPNYQPLYLKMLDELQDQDLRNEVLRCTYIVIQNLMNSESTLTLASERKNLKSLAIWLGSLTLARDKPIKRKHISFLDLLIEGLAFDKLVLVIPFTCNVLAQGKHSAIFKPPNPWIMEILEVLVELYQEVNITTNQKFDIEVLCDELGLDMKSIQPSNLLRDRTSEYEEPTMALLPDGMRGFDSVSMDPVNGRISNPRFEAGQIQFDLPDLEQRLAFPPANGTPASQSKLREIVVEAVTHAIYDIIGSVVERSVTIAAIATSQLIHKDFACEPDEDRVRQAAQQQVRQLASSLALVTAKEPLKTSMTNFIRKTQLDAPEHAFPEGTILMCVNDNLDTACRIVEEQAAEQSLTEMEPHVESEIASRRRHISDHPHESYIGPAHSRWATFIQDPFKIVPSHGGLSDEQMAIYSDFGRQPRGSANHVPSASIDSCRQLPDVLQDTYSSISHMTTPADSLSLSHQVVPPQQYQQQRGRMLPPPIPSAHQSQNGVYLDPAVIEDRILDQLADLKHIIKQYESASTVEFQREPAIGEMLGQVWDLASTNDHMAMIYAETICKTLHAEIKPVARETDILADILARLCQAFPQIAREVAQWADTRTDAELLIVEVTIELLLKRIMQARKVDEALARLISQKSKVATDALSAIVSRLLVDAHPSILRADFAKSLGALAEWYADDDHLPPKVEIWDKLAGTEGVSKVDPKEVGLVRKHHVNYVFSEWIRLCEENPSHLNDKIFAAFVMQMQVKKLLQTPEDMALFLRVSIDAAFLTLELSQQEERHAQRLPRDNINKGFIELDWLARLVVWLVRSAGNSEISKPDPKTTYMDSILSIITLIMNQHQVSRGEHFNQRAFFRLFSSILCYWHDYTLENATQREQMLVVFVENLGITGPRYFPAFTYSWLALISHRFLMPDVLKAADQKAYGGFVDLIVDALVYITRLLRRETLSPIVVELYSGLLRLMTLLHHDFPEFLADCHYTLCNAIPHKCTQLTNLILSANPSHFQDSPDPFVKGLRIDRVEEIRQIPNMSASFEPALVAADLSGHIDSMLQTPDKDDQTSFRIIDILNGAESYEGTRNSELAHAIVLYVVQSATIGTGNRATLSFSRDSVQTKLFTRLVKQPEVSVCCRMLNAMVNQLRWPNAHTQYFAYTILHLFGLDPEEHETVNVREQVTSILLNRLYAVKPHPWGLVVVMLELLKNPEYAFWQSPFVNKSPQIRALCEDFLKQGDDRESEWHASPYPQHT